MLTTRTSFTTWMLLCCGAFTQAAPAADHFDTLLQPLFAQHCIKCHGKQKVNGKVNLQQIESTQALLKKPQLIEKLVSVIGDNVMPPEGEPALEPNVRVQLLARLKTMLGEATSGDEVSSVRVRRLNRFQYNQAVRDLFQLKRDVFPLPEKLMTRQDPYLQSASPKMPDQVHVASHSLNPVPGFQNVKPFPQDLRAAHGFDNQANQLTLSPLLLDAFLRLSVSIVESPDFNQQNVGIWNDFFQQPAADADARQQIASRLAPFLELAFRGPVDPQTLDRYTNYGMSKIDQGLPFTDSMKKVASAVLSSPLFLYRTSSGAAPDNQYELASKLSFFLWGSGPDRELLQQAQRGELSRPENLQRTIQRMLADPKIERFLDTFPAQWMQLENLFAATPDPQQYKLFSLDQQHPASTQMVLEPLLLFDTVFIEDRPIVELIAPSFSYQSEFLKTWYTTDLKPPAIDERAIAEQNRRHDQRRQDLAALIKTTRADLDGLLNPIRTRLLEKRRQESGETREPVDMKPYAAWEFDGDLTESIKGLDLTAHGDIRYEEGKVILHKAYLLSKQLPIQLKAKTLEVWLNLPDVNQRGGGVMGIQGPGDFFDTIVLGERKPQHWISGSNGFSRTEDFPDSLPEEVPGQWLHLAMVYREDGTTTLYRNGKPYGQPFQKGAATFPQDQTSVIFGLRHLPPGGNKFLSVSLDRARLYNRALTAEEVALSSSGSNLYITEKELVESLTPEQRVQRETLHTTLRESEAALKKVPPAQDPRQLREQAQRRYEDKIRQQLRSQTFDRVEIQDPRYGGVITSAAMLSMTSGPKRTHPIARGAWVIEVIFNDPPPPPPNDVPPLNEEQTAKNLTIREKFAQHRENPDCAGCHSRLDPLGFALENFDITGRWRDQYENGRDVDASGTLLRKYEFDGVVRFKQSLVQEQRRFAQAFTRHLLRFALARELRPADAPAIDAIVDKTESDGFKLQSLIREVILSDRFLTAN